MTANHAHTFFLCPLRPCFHPLPRLQHSAYVLFFSLSLCMHKCGIHETSAFTQPPLALPAVEHLDELLEADDVAHAHRRVHRDEVVQVVLRLGRLQSGEEERAKIKKWFLGCVDPASRLCYACLSDVSNRGNLLTQANNCLRQDGCICHVRYRVIVLFKYRDFESFVG